MLLCSGAVCCSAAIQPAVGFRIDDNHTVRIWDTLAGVFKKHNARFSCSIIPFFGSDLKNADWRKKICELESEGFEIMDHTPNHSSNYVTFPEGDPRVAAFKDKPFVHHVTGRKVCLKYTPGTSSFSEPFTVKIFDKNKVSSSSRLARRMNLEIDGKHYYLTPTKDKSVFKLLTIWNEDNVNLPDGEKTVRRCLKERFQLADGGYDFLIQCSQDGFRKIGLKKMPRVWIQPGGYYPHLGINKLAEALRRNNYISASCSDNASMKGFADPGFDLSCYSMRWGNFNLENLKLQTSQTKIADTIACRRVAICSSHVAPERKYGKLKEYAAMYDQLLPWLKENNIKVMTQSELAEYLKSVKIDPKENIMPDLFRDIDKNKRPDGYRLGKTVSCVNGEITLKGKGMLVKVQELCGLHKGKVQFKLESKGSFSGKIHFKFIDSTQQLINSKSIVFNTNSEDWKKSAFEFEIPSQSAALDFMITADNPVKCAMRAFDLRAAN